MTRILTAAALMLAFAVPAALAAGPPSGLPNGKNNPGAEHKPAETPDGTTNPGSENKPAGPKGKGYGKKCQGQSKKHVAGQKGTPFSQCVTAMAKLDSGKTDSPETACKALSKEHAEGERGTPFSRCVSAGAKLLEDKQQAGPTA